MNTRDDRSPDIAAVLVARDEGALAGMSAASVEEAEAYARQAGFEVALLVVLGTADRETRHAVSELPDAGWTLVEADGNELDAIARATLSANGTTHVSFIRAGDLWSFTWLAEAATTAARAVEQTLVHAGFRWRFGDSSELEVFAGRSGTMPDLDRIRIADDYDTAFLAPRAALERAVSTDARSERDWRLALAAEGWTFVAAESTIHFQRTGRVRPGDAGRFPETAIPAATSRFFRFDDPAYTASMLASNNGRR